MAGAPRMATMAALLTATSGVVLVQDPKPNGGKDCCISKNADKLEIEDSSYFCWLSPAWRRGPEMCAAVKNNGKTFMDLRKCVWITTGEPETHEAAAPKIAVVFSGIRTIEAFRIHTGAKVEPNVLNDCGELFKRVKAAAEAEVPFTKEEEDNNQVAKAAYDKLLTEAPENDPKTDNFQDVKTIVKVKDTTGTSQITGSSDNNVVVNKTPEVKATIVPPKNTDSSDNTGGGKTPEAQDTQDEKFYETLTEEDHKHVQKGSPELDLEDNRMYYEPENIEVAEEQPIVKSNIEKVKTEAVETHKSKWHECMHKINTFLGIAKKKFVRAMRRRLALQE